MDEKRIIDYHQDEASDKISNDDNITSCSSRPDGMSYYQNYQCPSYKPFYMPYNYNNRESSIISSLSIPFDFYSDKRMYCAVNKRMKIPLRPLFPGG